MFDLRLEKINSVVVGRIKPFLNEVLKDYREKIHSIYIVGSSVTDDFDPSTSDTNTIFVLKAMELKFLDLIAPLGKRYGKKKVTAPLIMTPEYIESSLDVFPVEFMDIKLIHKTVLGDDLFEDIEISKENLRLQCERELKSRLIGLRQGYLSAQGDRRLLIEKFVAALSGYFPLFRSIIFLLEEHPPINKHEVISRLSSLTTINTDIFKKVMELKTEKIKLSKEELFLIFEAYYKDIERLGGIIDEIRI